MAFVSGCVKDEPDHRQSQDYLVVVVVSIVYTSLSFCSCSHGLANAHQEKKWK